MLVAVLRGCGGLRGCAWEVWCAQVLVLWCVCVFTGVWVYNTHTWTQTHTPHNKPHTSPHNTQPMLSQPQQRTRSHHYHQHHTTYHKNTDTHDTHLNTHDIHESPPNQYRHVSKDPYTHDCCWNTLCSLVVWPKWYIILPMLSTKQSLFMHLKQVLILCSLICPTCFFWRGAEIQFHLGLAIETTTKQRRCVSSRNLILIIVIRSKVTPSVAVRLFLG